jgi:hypothetical protein
MSSLYYYEFWKETRNSFIYRSWEQKINGETRILNVDGLYSKKGQYPTHAKICALLEGLGRRPGKYYE